MEQNEHSLTLYYREACHLCEDMLQQLHEIQQEHPFDLVQIDVDSILAYGNVLARWCPCCRVVSRYCATTIWIRLLCSAI